MMAAIMPWIDALFAASLKGSILLIIALAAVRCMRRASAESRHAVLATALVAFFILPAAGAFAPRWSVRVPDALTGALTPGRTAESAAPSSTSPEPASPPQAPPEPKSPPTSATIAAEPPTVGPSRGGDGLGVSAPATRVGASNMGRRIDWALAIGKVWLVGSLVISLRLLLGLAKLRMMSRRATMVTDGAWLQTAHGLARRLGLTRGVTLLRGDREAVPMTWGVLSPVVWLPPTADRWPSELRRAVLSHELAHVRRRDAVTQWLANAVVAIHWFNPLAWMAAAALRAERERACDDAVLSLGVEADDYAAQLLNMVRTLGGVGGPTPAMAMARRSQFEGRLLAILDRAVARGPVGAVRLSGLLATASALVLVFGGMRAADREVAQSVVIGPAAVDSSRIADSSFDSPVSERGSALNGSAIGRTATGVASRSVGAAPVVAADGSGSIRRATNLASERDTQSAADSSRPGRTDGGQTSTAARDATPSTLDVPSPVQPGGPSLRFDVGAPLPDDPSTLLHLMQGTAKRDTTLMLEIIAAAEGIASSSERVAVLERMAKRPDLEPEVVTALGAAAKRVTSATERAKLIRALIRNQTQAVGASRRAVLDAIASMTSSTDQSTLLIEFIGRPNLADSALSTALATSEKITSSSEKAKVLVTAARTHRIEGDARASFLRSARTITIDSERARALSALFDGVGSDSSGVKPPR